MIEEKRKSRCIPLTEYYDVLQLEFLSYYMRYLTYDRDIDKQKYFEFCKKKKVTIQNLSRRHCFHNIFDDLEYRKKKLTQFFNQSGLPNLVYRDEHQKQHLGFWDKIYYFHQGIDVFYLKSASMWNIESNRCKFEGDHDFVFIQQENKPTIKVNINELVREWDFKKFDFNIF